LDEDEYDRHHCNCRAEDIEQDFRGRDAGKLAPEFVRQKPVDRSHESHEEPDDHRVDVQDFGDIEMQEAEEQIRVDIIACR